TNGLARFANWYAQTKLEAEVAVREAGSANGLQTVILRPATVYGPRSVEVVGAIAKALHSGTMLLVDRGRAVAGLCYVDNLVHAAGLGCSPARFTIPYAVAHGLGRSLEHGYRGLRRTTGLTLPPLLSRQAVQVLGRDQSFSAQRAHEVLGWEPRVGYSAGLEA